MKNEIMYVCKECGSTDIEMLVWINVNTKKYVEEAPDDDIINQWCNKCERHVVFMRKEDWDEEHKTKGNIYKNLKE